MCIRDRDAGRFNDDRAGKCHTLLLTAGQLMRIPLGKIIQLYSVESVSYTHLPVFLFLINKMEQIGQYDHSNNYSKKKHGQSISGL